MSPLYEYECLGCRHYFDSLRSFDSDPDCCPACGGEIQRLVSVPSDARPTGFSSRRKDPDLVMGESGKLGRRINEIDDRDLEKGVRTDSKGRPKMTPTRPKPSPA